VSKLNLQQILGGQTFIWRVYH